MSCYHPLIAVPVEKTSEDKWKYLPQGLWSPEFQEFMRIKCHSELKPDPVKIPCKRCIGCRLDYSRTWADRMILELDHHKGKAIFLTLTYDDEHLPVNEFGFSTLSKRDLQLFMKRLRRALPDREIRFYAVGEYGSWEKTHRPHYHLILFGLSMEDFPMARPVARNELGQLSYSHPFLEERWKKGLIGFSEVSWKTCAYVSRYVQKKVYVGDESLIELTGIQPEFSLMSRNPGLSYFYFLEHPDHIGYTQFPSGDPNHNVSLPKYLIDKLPGLDYDFYEKVKLERKAAAVDSFLLELQKTDKEPLEYLSDKEQSHLRKVSQLKRNL